MVGVFGGTFDPIHWGHLRTVSEVQVQLGLSRVLIIPVNIPPHRSTPMAASRHRISMIQLALKQMPQLKCDDREIRRGGTSYTFFTVQELRQEFGEIPLCLILGLDSFLDLPNWYRWNEILDYVHIVVMRRPGWELPASLPDWCSDAVVGNPLDFEKKPYGNVYYMSVPSIDITSTVIRNELSFNSYINNALPSSVLGYIRRNKLYGNQ